MAIPERRWQQNQQRKAAKTKQQAKLKSSQNGFFYRTRLMASAIRSPIHACHVHKEIQEIGLGSVVVARKMNDGQIAVSHFLVDIYALGVKNAYFRIISQQDYDTFIISREDELEMIHPSCARKLIEGAVDFAKQAGFKPHVEYNSAKLIFGDIDRNACPTKFEFGKNGQHQIYINSLYRFDDDNDSVDSDIEHICDSDYIVDQENTENGVIRILEYEITDESIDHEYMREISDSDVDELDELYDIAISGKKEGIEKINQFIAKHPDLPQPHNFLYASYVVSGDMVNATKAANECLERFPNYLFGKIARAGLHIANKEFHKVPEIFQDILELSYHCDGRTRVHISEFVKFYGIVGQYYHAINNDELSKRYHKLLQSVAPDSPETRILSRKLYPSVLSRWVKKLIG